MSDMMNVITNNYAGIISAAASIIGGFAMIASMTPNKSDDRIVQMLLDIVNFLGANFGKASNNK